MFPPDTNGREGLLFAPRLKIKSSYKSTCRTDTSVEHKKGFCLAPKVTSAPAKKPHPSPPSFTPLPPYNPSLLPIRTANMASVIEGTPHICNGESAAPTSATTTTHPVCNPVVLTRKSGFPISTIWDFPVLKVVTAVDEHMEPHGEPQKRFEEAFNLFNPSADSDCFDTIAVPTWKTLNDCFKKILSDHRDAVRKNAVASGIISLRGEIETVLNDVMSGVDEWEETKREERDKKTETDRRPVPAGEYVRARVLSIWRSICSTDVPGTNSGTLGKQK